MITSHYTGRMGNWLFQYSLGRILAEKMGYQLEARAIEGFSTTETIVEGVVVKDNPIHFNNQFLEMDGKHISVDDVTRIKDRYIVLGANGFFQRYEYYKPHKEKIRQWLKTEYYDVGQTENDAIIHLRLGDCILGSLSEHPYVMPPEYFKTALGLMSFDSLYICSDPETLEHPMFHDYMESFKEYNPKLTGGNTIEDFNTIKSFNKIIMSQSTFSWWAAFLSEASEIFVPVPMGEHWGNEWSIESPGVALFVDDEERYKYIKQYDNEWRLVNLQDIEER